MHICIAIYICHESVLSTFILINEDYYTVRPSVVAVDSHRRNVLFSGSTNPNTSSLVTSIIFCSSEYFKNVRITSSRMSFWWNVNFVVFLYVSLKKRLQW